jgi:hypothetical protein
MTMAQLEKISIRKAVPNNLPQMLRIMDEVLETPTIDDEISGVAKVALS